MNDEERKTDFVEEKENDEQTESMQPQEEMKTEEIHPDEEMEKLDSVVENKKEEKTRIPQDTTVKQKKNVMNRFGKYGLACLLAAGCGFGGGYLGSKVNANSYEKMLDEKLAEYEEQNTFGFSMPSFGENGGSFMPDFQERQNDADQKQDAPGQSETGSAALGVYIQQMDSGIVITGFSDSSKAGEAGLQTGDVILEIDGNAYDSYDAIVSYIGEKKPGDEIAVTVARAGEKKTFTVTLVEKSSSSLQQRGMELPPTDSSNTIKS